MKKTILLVAATIMMVSCGLSNSSTTNSTASTAAKTTSTSSSSTTAMSAGQGAGTALQALYSQYKADGKYDYKNMQNILNTVTLVANCEGLKENYKDKSYLSEFGKGMVASSLGLVNQNNVESVTNSLVNMVQSNETVQNATNKVQSTASNAASYASTAATYANSLSTILSAFGGK